MRPDSVKKPNLSFVTGVFKGACKQHQHPKQLIKQNWKANFFCRLHVSSCLPSFFLHCLSCPSKILLFFFHRYLVFQKFTFAKNGGRINSKGCVCLLLRLGFGPFQQHHASGPLSKTKMSKTYAHVFPVWQKLTERSRFQTSTRQCVAACNHSTRHTKAYGNTLKTRESIQTH